MPVWLLSNPIASLLGVSTLVLTIALGVQTFRIEGFKASVAQANQQAAEARAQAEEINRIFSQNEAKNERARADQEAKNHAELEKIQSHTITLQATLNQKQIDYAKVSAQLKGIIANAPKTDSSPIGRTLRLYLDGLRQQQAEWHSNDNAPAGDRH